MPLDFQIIAFELVAENAAYLELQFAPNDEQVG